MNLYRISSGIKKFNLLILLFLISFFIACENDKIDFVEANNEQPVVTEQSVTEEEEEDEVIEEVIEEKTAFPNAFGYGRETGLDQPTKDIVYVTNLDDSGEGSFREAVNGGDRYVLFKVAGTITLKSPIQIRDNNIYIAGQTAFQNGGEGITIRSDGVSQQRLLSIHGDHVIMRYLRFRRGPGTPPENNGDGVVLFGNYWIIDHCSVSWCTDENLSSGACTMGTVQNSIISEGLYLSSHSKSTDPSEEQYQTGHSKGSLFGTAGAAPDKVTFFQNLYAHNNARNPKIVGTGRFEVVNNIMYNNGYLHTALTSLDLGIMETNVVKNLFIAGMDTHTNWYEINLTGKEDHVYVQGNIGWNRPSDSDSEWALVGIKREHVSEEEMSRSMTPFTTPLSSRYSKLPNALDLKSTLLSHVGASVDRDAVDERIINDVYNGTPTVRYDLTGISSEWRGTDFRYGIINDPSDVGGWPELKAMQSNIIDEDEDGMLDSWEIETFGDLSHNAYDDHNNNGWSNLEEYLEYCCKLGD